VRQCCRSTAAVFSAERWGHGGGGPGGPARAYRIGARSLLGVTLLNGPPKCWPSAAVAKNVAGYDVSRLLAGSWASGRHLRSVAQGVAVSRATRTCASNAMKGAPRQLLCGRRSPWRECQRLARGGCMCVCRPAAGREWAAKAGRAAARAESARLGGQPRDQGKNFLR